MPSSRPNHIPLVVNLLRQLRPTSILDVGVGFGKWGLLFREYTDIIAAEHDPARYRKDNWQIRIDGIEGFPGYLTPAHEYLYDKIHVGDMTAIIDQLERYDVIFAGDVIEHVDKAAGAEFIHKCLAKSNKALILSTPAREVEQGPACGNSLEVHRSFWTSRDFHAVGRCRTRRTEDEILLAVFLPAAAKFPKLTSQRRRPLRSARTSSSAFPCQAVEDALDGVEIAQRRLEDEWRAHRTACQEAAEKNAHLINTAVETLRRDFEEKHSAAVSEIARQVAETIAAETDRMADRVRGLTSQLEQTVRTSAATTRPQTVAGQQLGPPRDFSLQAIDDYFDQRFRRVLQLTRPWPLTDGPDSAGAGVTLTLPFEKARLAIRLPVQGATQKMILRPAFATLPPPPAASTPRASFRRMAARSDNGRGNPPRGKISVVMTTFNSAAYVRTAALNVLAQTYPNFELVVVDDASTDETFTVLLELSRKDPRVRPFKMFTNRGTYWCKNFGMTRSTGRYITFQDSDDASDPDRLRLQLQELQETGAVMCTCNYARVDDAGCVLLNRGRIERKAIMAPLLSKEEVIRHAGYFDCVRTSADDEFNRRIGIVFGHERICHIDRPLYRALAREGSLTTDARTKADIAGADCSESDQSYLSAPRREYVRQYRTWHDRLKAGAEKPRMPFPQLRRPFAVPVRLLSERRHGDNYVTASMASIPARQPLLEQAVASILPQVDVLNVYLNGYEQTPCFLNNPKVRVVHSREYGDLRDNGKFFFIDSVLSGYHFTIDDDIVYPADYVQHNILKIDHYNRQAIVGCHGVTFASPLNHFLEDREVLHFKAALARDRLVNLLGTGTTAYYVDAIELSLSDFKTSGMADLWLALAAKRQNIPLISIERPQRWLTPLDEADESSLYRAAIQDCRLQTELARGEEPWSLDHLYMRYPLIQSLMSRFGPEEIRSSGVDLRPLVQVTSSNGSAR